MFIAALMLAASLVAGLDEAITALIRWLKQPAPRGYRARARQFN